MSASSVGGCSRISGSEQASVCYDSTLPGWNVILDLPMTSAKDGSVHRLKATFSILATAESLAVLLPLPNDLGRVGYTHKVAGANAEGSLQLGNPESSDRLFDYKFQNGMATVDWTKQLARRTTIWKWVSVSARAMVRPAGGNGSATEQDVGINLSTDVFEDVHGVSTENAVWVDGKVQVLGNVAVVPPADTERSSTTWKILAGNSACDAPCESQSSASCECFDVTFKPRGAREEHLNVWLIQSDFVQPYGTFDGHVRLADGTRIQLQDAYGVCEDHLSVW